jgi:lambda family phage minor tail protein L
VTFKSTATARSALSTSGKATVGFTGKAKSTDLTIQGEVSSLRAQAIVEMFVYDDTAIGGDQILRWHPGTTLAGNPITWQGNVFQPLPIEASGFTMNLSGSLPRPQLKATNIAGELGAYLRSMDGAVGAKITRKRTLGKYLDAVNFVGGNSSADPTAFFPDEVYYLARKTSENPIYLEYELAVAFDVAGVQLPRRQVLATTCEWVYRSAECGYAGAPVQTIEGLPTTDPNLDRCRKTLDACRARFGSNPLNTSAFPASLMVQS